MLSGTGAQKLIIGDRTPFRCLVSALKPDKTSTITE